MWVCHITGTPGCSTALCSVPPHCTQARYFTRTAEVTICIISERLPHRPRQLPRHSLTAEAEGASLCCSRTTAVPSSPTQRTPRTKWGDGLPTMPTAAYLVAEGISPTTGPGREGKKRRSGVIEPACQHMVHAMKCGGDPTQPTYNHQSITDRHQSRPVCKPPLLFSPELQMMTTQVTKEYRVRKEAQAQISQGNLLPWISGSPLQLQLWGTGP